jgi:hypothetical protein
MGTDSLDAPYNKRHSLCDEDDCLQRCGGCSFIGAMSEIVTVNSACCSQ